MDYAFGWHVHLVFAAWPDLLLVNTLVIIANCNFITYLHLFASVQICLKFRVCNIKITVFFTSRTKISYLFLCCLFVPVNLAFIIRWLMS